MPKVVENRKTPSCLIVIPTYRERDNIAMVQELLRRQELSYELLVIDDGSDDGTQELLRQMQLEGQSVTVFQRQKKLGLGTAYTLAFAYACQTNHTYVVQMDADLSHDPADVPRLIEACREYDVVIGSRYTQGGSCQGWPWYRYRLSLVANWLAKRALRIRILDVTGGFKCLKRSWLQQLQLECINSRGFSFQWGFNCLALNNGANYTEIPICCRQRADGDSKMSTSIMLEGLWQLLRLGLRFRQETKGNNRIRH